MSAPSKSKSSQSANTAQSNNYQPGTAPLPVPSSHPHPTTAASNNSAIFSSSVDEGSSSEDFQSDDDYAWIPWFCSLKGNEFFCEVEESFAQDSFNLTGLNALVPYFDSALDMILDVEPNENLSEDQQEMIENDAETLYGVIHARYILTNRGLQSMLEKYRAFHFGRCPRVLCKGQGMLPIGLSDAPNQDSVKLYCPRCEDVYHCKASRHEHIDGAYFGTTFPHLFFLTFPELKVSKSKDVYVPRVFGFKVNEQAYKKSLDIRKKQNKQAKQLAGVSGSANVQGGAGANVGTGTGNPPLKTVE